jgi:hypothetical protein
VERLKLPCRIGEARYPELRGFVGRSYYCSYVASHSPNKAARQFARRHIKFCAMQNPFKTGDIVLTKLKGKEIQAAVSKIWKNEVQVKTTEGELLWRTMYTVWRPDTAPLARPVRQPKIGAQAPPAGNNGKIKQASKAIATTKPVKRGKKSRRRR